MITDQRLYSIMYLEESHVCNWSVAYSSYEILRQLGMGLVIYKDQYRETIKYCMDRMKEDYRYHTIGQTVPFQEKTKEEAIGRCTCHLDPTGAIFHYL